MPLKSAERRPVIKCFTTLKEGRDGENSLVEKKVYSSSRGDDETLSDDNHDMMAGSTVENLSNPEMSDGDWAPTNLRKNLCILSHNEIDLAKMLIKEKQGHLFEHWPEPGIDDAAKHGFFNQVTLLNNSYPGGLLSYIRNARSLLADSKAGKNPYDGFIPSVPSGEVLSFGDENFMMLEEVGVKEACRAAFVLVAGGLGERLGYNGIKLALPSESTSGTLFLQHYIESILALQGASCKLVEEMPPSCTIDA
ncbi:UDP-sugar pyrophosphorylase [Nymphaea thermarum]|nr:UDP-sugar pyrophosphorylase [Nymphaea thermarum]